MISYVLRLSVRTLNSFIYEAINIRDVSIRLFALKSESDSFDFEYRPIPNPDPIRL